jgi:hypothetical protein
MRPEHRTEKRQDQALSYQSLQHLQEVPLLAKGEQKKNPSCYFAECCFIQDSAVITTTPAYDMAERERERERERVCVCVYIYIY